MRMSIRTTSGLSSRASATAAARLPPRPRRRGLPVLRGSPGSRPGRAPGRRRRSRGSRGPGREARAHGEPSLSRRPVSSVPPYNRTAHASLRSLGRRGSRFLAPWPSSTTSSSTSLFGSAPSPALRGPRVFERVRERLLHDPVAEGRGSMLGTSRIALYREPDRQPEHANLLDHLSQLRRPGCGPSAASPSSLVAARASAAARSALSPRARNRNLAGRLVWAPELKELIDGTSCCYLC